MYADFAQFEWSRFVTVPTYQYPKNQFLNSFLHHWLSLSRREKIELPFKSLLFKKYLHIAFEPFDDDKPLCFILYGRVFEFYGKTLTKRLRKRYKQCRIVCYLGDLLASFQCSMHYMRSACDVICTFDKGEAEKYGLVFCQEPFSWHDVKTEFGSINKRYDVTFVGLAKNRLTEILRLYSELTARGFLCDFHIFGVPKEAQLYPEHISYNKRLSFKEVLRHVLEAHCILEIMQVDGVSPTTRFSEAMLYERNLLTNCRSLASCAKKNVSVFDVDHPERIDYDFIRKPCTVLNDSYKELLSIKTMVRTVEAAITAL